MPQIFGVEGYGARPDQHLEPEIADWEWIYLAYNEPNQPDQSDIPPKIAAQNYKELTEQYPEKGTFLSGDTDDFVISPNRRPFYFPELKDVSKFEKLEA